MKILHVSCVLFSLVASVAHARAAETSGACGADGAQYSVKLLKHHPLTEATSADATRIVFIQTTDGDFSGDPVTRFAVDGSWVGANKGDSYFAIDVPAGTHKICSTRQGSTNDDPERVHTETVNVATGKTVFVKFTITRSAVEAASQHAAGQALGYATPDMTAKRQDTVDSSKLKEISADEAMPLATKFPLSTSTVK